RCGESPMNHLVDRDPVRTVTNAAEHREGKPRNGGGDRVVVPPSEIGRASAAPHKAKDIELERCLMGRKERDCFAHRLLHIRTLDRDLVVQDVKTESARL